MPLPEISGKNVARGAKILGVTLAASAVLTGEMAATSYQQESLTRRFYDPIKIADRAVMAMDPVDFNRDGKIDFAAGTIRENQPRGDEYSRLRVLEQRDNLTFEEVLALKTGANPWDLEPFDLGEDGDIDFAVSNKSAVSNLMSSSAASDGQIELYINSGDNRNFRSVVISEYVDSNRLKILPSISSTSLLVSTQVNGDDLYTFLIESDGSYIPKVYADVTGNGSFQLERGDIIGGDADEVVFKGKGTGSENESVISIVESDGRGNLLLPGTNVTIPCKDILGGMKTEDLFGSEKQEVIVKCGDSSSNEGDLIILENRGGQLVQTLRIDDDIPRSGIFGFGDIDLDRKKDILLFRYIEEWVGPLQPYWRPWTGNSFASPRHEKAVIKSSGFLSRSSAVLKVDGDDLVDIAVGTEFAIPYDDPVRPGGLWVLRQRPMNESGFLPAVWVRNQN